MCQATVILKNEQGGKAILEDVIHLRIEGETIWFERFFEDPIAVKGAISEIDFLKHSVSVVLIRQAERTVDDKSR
ncbi:MAG: CooT family nickel-binding protein [Anaerolineales bacterium]|jgi:predicted RNA-binding protein